MYCYTLPKLWLGRIQKYWDKVMPVNYPTSGSTFSLKFETVEVKAAVEKMEEEIGAEGSIVTELAPEGTMVTNYVGTYDVVGTPGEKTLLSPEKVDTNSVLVLHLVEDNWEVVEDVTVENGYVWGTLENFSPVAVFEYAKTFHMEEAEPTISKDYPILVCEGNPIKVTEVDGVVKVQDLKTGLVHEITEKTTIVGGSIDGSTIESVDIVVEGIKSDLINKIYVGSAYSVPEIQKCEPATVKTAKISIKDSGIRGITGSIGAVRVDSLNINANNCTAYFYGFGESTTRNGEANPENPTLENNCWVMNASMNLINCEVTYVYIGGNCGYTLVDNAIANFEGCKFTVLTSGGSNGRVNNYNIVAKNSVCGWALTTNRGYVGKGKITLDNCIDTVANIGSLTKETLSKSFDFIKFNICGSKPITISAGSYNATRLTKEMVADKVEIDVERYVNCSYTEGSEEILADVINVK